MSEFSAKANESRRDVLNEARAKRAAALRLARVEPAKAEWHLRVAAGMTRWIETLERSP